ncbi:MAG: GAF domain-containing protein, partial [Phycisphaerales bacterium]
MPFRGGQEKFQKRQDLLQAVLDSLTHPFYVIDVASYQVRLANRAALDIRAAGATTCHALVHGNDGPCAAPDHPCPVEIIKETGQPVVVEHVHYDQDGGQRTVEVHAFPIRDETGRIVQVIESCIDITDHRRVVEQHEWELAVNRAIVELADALIDPSSSIEEIADIVLQQARQLTHSEHGYVSSLDPETGDMTSHTLTHMMGRQCQVAPEKQDIIFHLEPNGRYPGLWGHALNTTRGFYSNDPSAHPASTGLPEGHIALRNFLTVPALVGEEVVGQIALANADQDYCDQHLEAVGRIAKLYALAVQRWRGGRALKKSEERYALAQAAANIGSWDWNIGTGKLLWSDCIEPMFGFATGQFDATYAAFLACVHPSDRQ